MKPIKKIVRKGVKPFTFAQAITNKKQWEEVKKGMETPVTKNPNGNDLSFFATITKIDEEKRMVYGTATTESVDHQDEVVDWEGTKNAIPEFLKWRNLREMHQDKAAGTIPEVNIDDVNKKLEIGAHVVDDSAWKKVKEGVYKGFSIGGKSKSKIKEIDKKLGKSVTRIKEYILSEISLVDRPANPECTFSMMKRDDSAGDPLNNEVQLLKSKIETLERMSLKKEDISKLADKDFGLIRKIHEAGGNLRKERWFPMPDKVHAQGILGVLPRTKGLTKGEKLTIHAKAVNILGKKHDPKSCSYCHYLEKITGGGEIMTNEERMAKARQLLKEVEDSEAQVPGEGTVVSENLETARQNPQFDPQMAAYPGPAESGEGEYYEDAEGNIYTREDLEGGLGNDRLGYAEGMPYEDERTQIFESQPEQEEKYAWEPEAEESEGVYDDPEGGNSCPYCGTTMKMLQSDISKGIASERQCPCGQIYRSDIVPTNIISAPGMQARPMAKSDGAMISEIAKRDALIDQLCTRVEDLQKMVGTRPAIRKFTREVEGEQEAIQKADDLQKAMSKAMEIREIAKMTGKPPTPEDEAFCKRVMEASIAQRVTQR
jgi:hypothetical protein